MKFRKSKKEKIPDDVPVLAIVSDSIIQQRNFADGKSIPLVILDTIKHPEIEKAIELHSGIESGKEAIRWGKTTDSKLIILRIDGVSPVEITFIILFDPYKHAGLIDIILKSHLLFIQGGKGGDKLIHNIDKPRLLLEIPSTDFEGEIKKILYKAKIQRFKNLNVKRKDLKKMVKSFNEEWEQFLSKRFK